MKKYLLYTLILFVLTFWVSSCSEDADFGPTIYDPTTPYLSEVDQWIR